MELDRKFNPVDANNWETFLYLYSWSVFNDTLPAMFWIGILCLFNGWVLMEKKLYAKKFVFYIIVCYLLYSTHTWLLNYEMKTTGEAWHIYDIATGAVLFYEFNVMWTLGEKYFNVKIPIISKLLSIFNDMTNSYGKRKQ